jgi:beta-fructofuranosidase
VTPRPERDAGIRPRPGHHISAPRNWLNDPNGPVWWDGAYHLFHQYNPDAPRWGRPHWGHVVSRDLVRWEHRGVALAPSRRGPDRDGCWSGCVRVIAGTPTAFYTGVSGPSPRQRVEAVCRATSSGPLDDWEKDDVPLIAGPPSRHPVAAHRDPFVFRARDRWWMLLGTSLEDVLGGLVGAVIAYASDDLDRWKYAGEFLRASPADPVTGGGVLWECPQLARFPQGDLLIVSIHDPARQPPMLHPVWFLGEVTDSGFVVETSGRLDLGDLLYAPALLPQDDRPPLLWGWVRELGPERALEAEPFAGALSLAREVHLREGRVELIPAPELVRLRRRTVVMDGTVIPSVRPWEVEAPAARWELELTCEGQVSVLLRGPAGELLQHIETDPGRVLGLGGRGRSSRSRDPDGLVDLRILVDQDIIESYVTGLPPRTARIGRGGPPAARIRLEAPEGAVCARLRLHTLADGMITGLE